MSANRGFPGVPDAAPFPCVPKPFSSPPNDHFIYPRLPRTLIAIDEATRHFSRPLSQWSRSFGKRLFDLSCVVCSLPVAVPAFLAAGLAVRVTSRGPVLFRQQRMGRDGHTFTIYKFRTMPVRRSAAERPSVTTSVNQRFTAVGPFLRRWKLDELPQLINVLRGDMSLVGPRPKLPRHQTTRLACRPGITGRATIVFAREEVALATVPVGHLDAFYHGVVLPLKQMLDEEYMSRATFASDFELILKSVLRNWDDVALTDLPALQPHLAQFTASRRIPSDWPARTSVMTAVMPDASASLSQPWQQG